MLSVILSACIALAVALIAAWAQIRNSKRDLQAKRELARRAEKSETSAAIHAADAARYAAALDGWQDFSQAQVQENERIRELLNKCEKSCAECHRERRLDAIRLHEVEVQLRERRLVEDSELRRAEREKGTDTDGG